MKRYLLCGVALAVVAAPPAWAQATADDDTALSEVIVTARKRDERLQEIPAAGSVLTAERLREVGGVVDLRNFTALLPGVSLVDNDSVNSEFAIRGAGQAGRNVNADSAIALLRNGAQVTGGNIGGRGFARMDMFDVGQIEVLRGAQGSLYGANAVGGVISVVSQEPGPTFGAQIEAGYNFNKEGVDLIGIVNAPINDVLSLRLGIDATEQYGGRVYNTFRKEYIDGGDYRGVRAALAFTPDDRFKVVATVDLSRLDDPTGGQVDVQRRLYPAIPETFDYQTQAEGNTKARLHQNIANGSLSIKADLGFAELSSTTNARWRDSTAIADDDGRYPGAPLLSNGQPNIAGGATCRGNNCYSTVADQVNVFYQEVRLNGEAGALTWAGGVDFRALSDTYTVVSYGRVQGTTPVPASYAILDSDNRTFGAFGTGSYKITPQLTAEASLRWTQDEKELFGGLSNGAPVKGSIPRRERTFVNWTYGGSLSWQPSSRLNLYARFATGFRAGGYNRDFGTSNALPGNPATPLAYDEESTTAYEAGLKFEASRALQVTAAVFRTDYRDVLVSDTGTRFAAQGGGAFIYLDNLGDAKATGAEVELNGIVAVPTIGGRFIYTLAGTWIDSTLDSPIATVDGNKLNGTPDFALTANGTYSRPITGAVEGFLNVAYKGEWDGYYNISNLQSRDTNRSLQLRAGVRHGAKWELALKASNLLNQRYEFLYGTGFLVATPGPEYVLQFRSRF
ncbi:TonB-dependent receptor [Phenylobacterium sp.]|uniref:TonB-dependent receptor n=1 Tax=Phenylobacterium sp. TaxID=1871053 RepID=UPI0025E3C2A8|nr:TonB-dependent receptor [Phenylobacterium sp.]